MIAWKKQGAAWVGARTFSDGARGNVVIVGSREIPKGAVLLFPGTNKGALQSAPLAEHLDKLTPQQVVDILCMQERAFGESGLQAPPDLS